MTGGGFGGCTVSLVETAKVDEVARHLAQSYRAQTGIEPAVLTSRPARGACGAVGVKHTAAVLAMCDCRIQGHTYTQLLEPADLNCRSNRKEDE